ncbi:hypothetical protein QCA50_005473 [Cerrena zonata]|uniref:Alcohol dehydrogenase n=1 Tax=Cerrena zonata TaxID=2478898 RepID=A0AAW0GF04_9APHY
MGGAKIVVVTANDGNVLNSFLEGLCIGGTLLLLSFPTPTPLALREELPNSTTWDMVLMLLFKRCSIRGWPAGDAKACEEAIQFARAFGIKSLNEVFTLDQAPEAYEYRTKARFRAVIVPQTQA